jgi:hypothetical protein
MPRASDNAIELFYYVNIVGCCPSCLVYVKYTVFCKVNALPSSGIRGKDPIQLRPLEGAGPGYWV